MLLTPHHLFPFQVIYSLALQRYPLVQTADGDLS
jgi:hypothetical protein